MSTVHYKSVLHLRTKLKSNERHKAQNRFVIEVLRFERIKKQDTR